MLLSKCGPVMLDLGCGYGRSAKLLKEVCKSYVIGVDVDFEKLCSGRDTLSDLGGLDFICADAASLPLRDSSIDSVTAVLTLHEVGEAVIDRVLEEVRRVLSPNGNFLVIDKALITFGTPAEELTIMTELAYHKALEYVQRIRAWGVREVDKIIKKIVSKNFRAISSEIVVARAWISSKEFLASWGKDTVRLAQMIRCEAKRRELQELIHKIKNTARKHGYGPVKVLVAVFQKQENLQANNGLS